MINLTWVDIRVSWMLWTSGNLRNYKRILRFYDTGGIIVDIREGLGVGVRLVLIWIITASTLLIDAEPRLGHSGPWVRTGDTHERSDDEDG